MFFVVNRQVHRRSLFVHPGPQIVQFDTVRPERRGSQRTVQTQGLAHPTKILFYDRSGSHRALRGAITQTAENTARLFFLDVEDERYLAGSRISFINNDVIEQTKPVQRGTVALQGRAIIIIALFGLQFTQDDGRLGFAIFSRYESPSRGRR